MFKKLAVCYAVYFKHSYYPCDYWLLAEIFMSIAVFSIVVAIVASVLKLTKTRNKY